MERFCCLMMIVVIMMAAAAAAKTCRKHTDCRCGEVCVRKQQTACTASKKSCKCQEGCVLADQYFRPGETRRVYCNLCSCSSNPRTGSIIPCTRMAWCDLPQGYPLYPEQPECPLADLIDVDLMNPE